MSTEPNMASHFAPQIVWVHTDSLQGSLDAVTWLETTRELRSLGWQTTLISAGPSRLKSIQGIPVHLIPKPDIYLLRQVIFHARVLLFLVKHWAEIDIIFFHQMSAPWLLPLRLLRKLKRQALPLVIMDTRTVPMIPSHLASSRDRLRNAFDTLMNRIANILADGQTSITLRMAQATHIPAGQLLGVWPSGVNQDRFATVRTKRCWPQDEDPIHLIYVGAVQLERHLTQLAEAVVAANQADMRFCLTVVGDGSARMVLEKMAQQTPNYLRIILPVPHEQVPAYLAQAHVGVLPFPDEERFRVSSPIKLFEYMAAGLPILATRIVCHTDVMGSGSYAFWAEDATVAGLLMALEAIWQQRNELPAKSRGAAMTAAEWTWSAAARKLSRALELGLRRAGCDYNLPDAPAVQAESLTAAE
jgi:glycosyltransferase involved in cell wall biosynthesis